MLIMYTKRFLSKEGNDDDNLSILHARPRFMEAEIPSKELAEKHGFYPVLERLYACATLLYTAEAAWK